MELVFRLAFCFKYRGGNSFSGCFGWGKEWCLGIKDLLDCIFVILFLGFVE